MASKSTPFSLKNFGVSWVFSSKDLCSILLTKYNYYAPIWI